MNKQLQKKDVVNTNKDVQKHYNDIALVLLKEALLKEDIYPQRNR